MKIVRPNNDFITFINCVANPIFLLISSSVNIKIKQEDVFNDEALEILLSLPSKFKIIRLGTSI